MAETYEPDPLGDAQQEAKAEREAKDLPLDPGFYKCPVCKGEGSFEEWANTGCAPGDERFKVTKCGCCDGNGTVEECTDCPGEPAHGEHHDDDGSCHAPEPDSERPEPDYDRMESEDADARGRGQGPRIGA